MAGGSQDFTELRERSSQIKKEAVCVCVCGDGTTESGKQDAYRKLMGSRQDNKKGHRFAAGSNSCSH